MFEIVEPKGWRMITLTVITKVIPRNQKEFLQTVRSLTCALDRKWNSKSHTFYQEIDDQTVFNLVCELRTKEDLKKFIRAEEFKVLLGAFRVLCEKSKIRYRYICQNWPRHACATYGPPNRKSTKKVDWKDRGPKSIQRSNESFVPEPSGSGGTTKKV